MSRANDRPLTRLPMLPQTVSRQTVRRAMTLPRMFRGRCPQPFSQILYFGLPDADGLIRMTVTDTGVQEKVRKAVDQSIEVIRRRIDATDIPCPQSLFGDRSRTDVFK